MLRSLLICLMLLTSLAHAVDDLEVLRKFAEQGNAAKHNICLEQGYDIGVGVLVDHIDHAEAVRWFRKAAEQGHAEAQFRLGAMYDSSVKAFQKMMLKPCTGGVRQPSRDHAGAQFNLGVMYANGAKAFQKMMLKPCSGTASLLSKETLGRSSI